MKSFETPEKLVEEAIKTQNPVKYWYMASVYSLHKGGYEAAFVDANRVAAWLMERGVNVMAPISHTHPIAKYTNVALNDHTFWMRQDKPIVFNSVGIIVAMMDGWDISKGITMERGWAYELGKPVLGLDVEAILNGTKPTDVS